MRNSSPTCPGGTISQYTRMASVYYDQQEGHDPQTCASKQMSQVHGAVVLRRKAVVPVTLAKRMERCWHHGQGVGTSID